MKRRTIILTACWIIAFLIALSLDLPVARWIHTTGIGQLVEGTWWAQVLKAPGQFAFTIGVAVLVLILQQIRWKQAVFVVLASALSGTHVLIKWAVGRTRPYKLPGPIQPRPFNLHPFRDGLYGFFHQTNLSFPSGHVCPVSALWASMVLVWPRGGWYFAVLVLIVGMERVAENAHYCSDVIAAVAFGVLSSLLLHRFLSGWINPNQGKL